MDRAHAFFATIVGAVFLTTVHAGPTTASTPAITELASSPSVATPTLQDELPWTKQKGEFPWTGIGA